MTDPTDADLDALVFDAFGTVFDVHTVVALAEKLYPGHGTALSRLWRAKQIEYMLLRTVMGRYAPFDVNNEAALLHALRALGLPAGDRQRADLLAAYERLDVFPDAAAALPALAGYRRALLSVGTPALLDALVHHAGLEAQFDALYSVDAVRVYKPDPRTYQMASDGLKLPRHRIGFVTSNYFDVAGAKAFGMVVYWVNRSGALPDELGLLPDVELRGIDELAARLARRPAAS